MDLDLDVLRITTAFGAGGLFLDQPVCGSSFTRASRLPIVFITGTKVGRRCHGVNMARQSKAVASLGCGSPQTGRT
jgi:hypothetical protein